MFVGRGMVIISSTVVATTSLATWVTSGSVPVLTGHRSTPGLAASVALCATASAPAAGVFAGAYAAMPAAALIFAAATALNSFSTVCFPDGLPLLPDGTAAALVEERLAVGRCFLGMAHISYGVSFYRLVQLA